MLLHFDGLNWSKFPFFIPPQGVHIQDISGESSNNIYITGYKDSAQPFEYLYHFNGSKWSIIDSSYISDYDFVWKFGVNLKTIGGSLYSYYYKLYKKEENNWVKINDNLINTLGGSASDNLLAAGVDDNGTVNHYNGSDWKKLIIKEGFYQRMIDIWTDETETFMVANDVSQTFVIHGK